MTIPQLAAATGLTNGFISQLERDLTSASLSSLARIAAALDVRLGHLVDGTPVGEAQTILTLRGQEHLLLSRGDEMRFHVTESRIAPGASAGDQLYTLPGGRRDRLRRRGRARAPGGRHRPPSCGRATRSPTHLGIPHTWRNPSATEPAVVLWLAVPNPYARL